MARRARARRLDSTRQTLRAPALASARNSRPRRHRRSRTQTHARGSRTFAVSLAQRPPCAPGGPRISTPRLAAAAVQVPPAPATFFASRRGDTAWPRPQPARARRKKVTATASLPGRFQGLASLGRDGRRRAACILGAGGHGLLLWRSCVVRAARACSQGGPRDLCSCVPTHRRRHQASTFNAGSTPYGDDGVISLSASFQEVAVDAATSNLVRSTSPLWVFSFGSLPCSVARNVTMGSDDSNRKSLSQRNGHF
jgi:hypothetical protein